LMPLAAWVNQDKRFSLAGGTCFVFP